MVFLLVLIMLGLAYLAFWLTPKNLRDTLADWLATGWANIQAAAIEAGHAVGDATGDFAKWVTDEFWVGLHVMIRRIAIFSVFNILALVAFIYAPGMHDAILGWFFVNTLLALFGLEVFGVGTGIVQKLRRKDAAPAKRVLTRNVAIYFFILAWLGISEWAVPGVLRYGSWVVVLIFSVLVLGEAWRVYTDATVGNLGGTVLIIYFAAMAAVGVYNQKIQPHQLDQYLLHHRYAAVNYGLTTKVEAITDLQIYEKKETGWGFWVKANFTPVAGDSIKIGTVIDVPVSREDYLEQNIPFEDYGRNRLIPFVLTDSNGLVTGAVQYIVMAGTRLWDEPAAKSATYNREFKTAVEFRGLNIPAGSTVTVNNPAGKRVEVHTKETEESLLGKPFVVEPHDDPAKLYFGDKAEWIIFSGIGCRIKVAKIDNLTYEIT